MDYIANGSVILPPDTRNVGRSKGRCRVSSVPSAQKQTNDSHLSTSIPHAGPPSSGVDLNLVGSVVSALWANKFIQQ